MRTERSEAESATLPEEVQFGAFRLTQRPLRLWRGRKAVALQPRPLSVLRYLVEHPDTVVSSELLRQAVWGKTIVSPTTVQVCIRAVRKALGDEAEDPHYIETVGQDGYRFIEKVASSQYSVASREKEQQKANDKTIRQAEGLRLKASEPPPSSPFSLKPTAYSLSQDSGFKTQHPVLVGRDAELVQLHNLLEKALTGECQLVFISGEAGIGKTTLVDTFLQSLESRVQHHASDGKRLHPVGDLTLDPRRQTRDANLWLSRGQCMEHYGEGEAYLPVLEAMGQLCQGPGGGTILAALRRYAPTWLLSLPALIEPAEREQLQRQGAGTTPARMLREMAEALEAMSAEHGLVLVLEDLHVSDPSTVELLTYLAQRRTSARLMIIGLYRPVEVAVADHPLRGRVQELLARGFGVRLALELFTEVEVEAYLQQRLATTTLPAALGRQIWRRTDGNPLFVLNMVEYLLKRQVLVRETEQWVVRGELSSSAIPDTLQHLLSKQLDDLPAEQQRLLEVASVVEAVFPVASVAAGMQTTLGVVEEVCEELVRRGLFLEDRGVTTWPDGTLTGQYSFRHAFYHEALYQRVGSARRARLHLAIGLREEAGYADCAGEHAVELARHFEQGQETGRAIHYLLTAGQNALRKAASTEASQLLSHALTLVGTHADTPLLKRQELEIQLGLVTALMLTKGFAAPEVEQALLRAQALCQQLGETPDLLPVLTGLWVFSFARGDMRTARQLAEQTLRLAQQTADPAWLGVAQTDMQMTLYLQGELSRARQSGEQAIVQFAVAPSIPLLFTYSFEPRVRVRGYGALILCSLGYLDQARQQSQAALKLARELGPTQTIGSMLYVVANIHGGCREWEKMQAYATELITFTGVYDFPLWWAMGTCAHGIALTQQGKLAEGIEQIQQGLAFYRLTGAKAGITRILGRLAEAYGRAGQINEGFAVLEEALAVVEQHGERLLESELYRWKGTLTLQKFNVQGLTFKDVNPQSLTPNSQAEAEECFWKAIAIARRQEAKLFELRATTSLARLWRQQGKTEEAHQQLAEIYGWFTEGFGTKDLQDARELLEELSHIE